MIKCYRSEMELKDKKILITGITDSGVLRVRSELIKWLLSEGAQIIVATPKMKAYLQLQEMGCRFIEMQIDAHGINPIKDFRLYRNYIKVFKREKPNVVLTFTTKPNIYATYACRRLNIKYITNITGRGRALVNPGWKQKLMVHMLKFSLADASCIFFQNDGDKQFFIDHHIGKINSYRRIPGSGVNLEKFTPVAYPSKTTNEVNFLFISRIYKEKGIEQFVEAAKLVRQKHPECYFHILGDNSPEYEEYVRSAMADGSIIYHGRVSNVGDYIAKSHCLIHPSFFEGMANVILEAAASARPVITSNIHGCLEGVDNGSTGYIFQVKDTNALVEKIYQFLDLKYEDKVAMGHAGRLKIEREFDRNIVTEAYKEQINKLIK